jgi:hypothetical protein
LELIEMTVFLITIDTEGDNIWAGPEAITTENARFVGRFQLLCEKYGFKPTWLTNYEMATCPTFVSFAKAAIGRGHAEVGMHLHAWNSPPVAPLTKDDFRFQPYLIEYSNDLIESKIVHMTKLLSETFGTAMRSHRAGRWAFNAHYARTLADLGYTTDCSVTPHVDWRSAKGDPAGDGGVDYRHFPSDAYFLDPTDISRAGTSTLLELPMTIEDSSPKAIRPLLAPSRSPVSRAARRVWPVHWLRPNGRNLGHMKRLVDKSRALKKPYVEFMLHSSELMPGGSPTFASEASIENLYDHMEKLFLHMSREFTGSTLSEYRNTFDIN